MARNLVCAGLTVFGPIAALSLLGFTSTGIAAGSFAAWIQSVVYGGATGGIFSILQSMAMGGTKGLSVENAKSLIKFICAIDEIFD